MIFSVEIRRRNFYAKTNYHTMGLGLVMLLLNECIKIMFRLSLHSIPPLCWRRSRCHLIIGPKDRSIGFGKCFYHPQFSLHSESNKPRVAHVYTS